MQLLGAEPIAPVAILANFAVNLLPVLGLMVAILGSVLALRLQAGLYALLVPAIHALSLLLLLGVPLSRLELPVGPLLLGLLGYMLYRLGRAAAGLDLRVSIAFAALCVVVLVALPLSLYMVIAPGPGPI